MLAERNRRWLAKFPTLPAQSLVVVGALHIYGADGLLEGAKRSGYQVKPVTN
ncbi:TraB/GumN family protein [Aeromonas veronii]|uniref:TraB/GumN family protein n=1 Tax=Aeromonas veronii TaxID=654 RepID=UPI0038B5DE7B